MTRSSFVPRPQCGVPGVPFSSPEEVWFWFVQAYEARAAGARVIAGDGIPRPCEPLDIMRIIDRLYRQRQLLRDHLCVLVHYGRRLLPPSPYHHREMRANSLWHEAFKRITPVLREKGIIA